MTAETTTSHRSKGNDDEEGVFRSVPSSFLAPSRLHYRRFGVSVRDWNRLAWSDPSCREGHCNRAGARAVRILGRAGHESRSRESLDWWRRLDQKMTMKRIRPITWICGAVLTAVASGACAIGPMEMGDLKERIAEAMASESSNDAIDIKVIPGEWQANQARAKVKYDKPHYYAGTLKRIVMRNDSDADLVLDAGAGKEITAILFPYQLGPWVRNADGKFAPQGGLTTMEFAAQYDAGQKFALHCKQALPVMLMDCLAMPVEVL